MKKYNIIYAILLVSLFCTSSFAMDKIKDFLYYLEGDYEVENLYHEDTFVNHLKKVCEKTQTEALSTIIENEINDETQLGKVLATANKDQQETIFFMLLNQYMEKPTLPFLRPIINLVLSTL